MSFARWGSIVARKGAFLTEKFKRNCAALQQKKGFSDREFA